MTQIGLDMTLPSPAPIPVESVPGPDLGRCFQEAMDVYKRNVLLLVLASALFDVLSLVSLLILCGPLCAGFSRMTLLALERPDRKIELGDLFHFDRFGRLVGLFFLVMIATMAGLLLAALPGLFLMTIWLYPFYLVIERDATLTDSLRDSFRLVWGPGFWRHALLVLVVLALSIIPEMVPFIGWPLGWFVTPIAWLLTSSAYRQVTRAAPNPRAFPVGPAATSAAVPAV